MAALLRPVPGVVVRAETPAMVALRLIDLATRHGWSEHPDDPQIIEATRSLARADAEPTGPAWLAPAGRNALTWLAGHAVPHGWELIETDHVIVLDRIA